MATIRKDFGPKDFGEDEWKQAIGLLQASDAFIAHIDAGLAPHGVFGASIGYAPNVQIAKGRNFFDPAATGGKPEAPLTIGPGPVANRAQIPDHGVRTACMILGQTDDLTGVAPGAKLRPYRVANGPVFIGPAKTSAIGEALKHAMGQGDLPASVSVSMGNPGASFIHLLNVAGFDAPPGMAANTVEAINKAYEQGVIVVCAGGQIIRTVAYPARFGRTIAVGGLTEPADRFTAALYPTGGYGPDFPIIDVWAQAQNLNRAAVVKAGGETLQFYAETDDPRNEDRKPVGTSYAAPQVAAAAALWRVFYGAQLRQFDEKWKIVEAFRKALRASASEKKVRLGPNSDKRRKVRALDIGKLMKTPPDMTADYVRVRRHSAHSSWL